MPQAASVLDHPNVATIHEIGEWEDQPFIAMAYYEGETLRQRLERAPLSITEIASVAVQVASAFAAAHAAGIVHRDLKPANIIITGDAQAKVLAFGIAKMVTPHAETVTRLTGAGTTVGTVAYMSPEHARGEDVDERADMWAFGVLLYEMLTRRLAMAGTGRHHPKNVGAILQIGGGPSRVSGVQGSWTLVDGPGRDPPRSS